MSHTMKKSIVICILGLVGYLASNALFAQQLTSCSESAALSWTTPIAREDGSALPFDEIQGYELMMVIPGVPVAVNVSLAPDVNTFTHENPIPDCGAGDVEYTIATVDIGNRIGAFYTPPVELTFNGGFQVMESAAGAPTGVGGAVSADPTVELPACTSVIIENCTIENFTVTSP